jgi:cobalamin biosynthetic protein CobC
LDSLDVLVLSNPNNPTGVWFSRAVLLEWWSRLAKRNGWLVVDEAFMDATPERSLAPTSGLPGLVILRSLGKFFGLAGARVGFALGPDALLQLLRELLGPWTVTGPGRWVATQALNDRHWQRETRQSLPHASARLAGLLSRQGLSVTGGTSLFQWSLYQEAAALKERLAHQGIWVRCFDAPPSLRFGLPGNEAAWRRLADALHESGAKCLARL